ncbi:MAG: hypothetical protein M1827_007624 [Pycnora praestabilis]|nr:MAG: hypothetical protein M1827_007624 [Pycnora praestabilis]
MPYGRPTVAFKSKRHQYKVHERLSGSGTSGVANNGGINIVRRRSDSRLFIEKNFKQKDIENGWAAVEIRLPPNLKHRNVINYIDAFIDTGAPSASLYSEWGELGTVDSLIARYQEHNNSVNECLIWSVYRQVISALKYIHFGIPSGQIDEKRNSGWVTIIHRDIKPSNIFLSRVHAYDSMPRVILGDFGRTITSTDFHLNGDDLRNGDPEWLAPESPEYSIYSDVWMAAASIRAMTWLGRVPGYRFAHWNVPSDVGASSVYTSKLTTALLPALSRRSADRPSAEGLATTLRLLERTSGAQVVPLPTWACPE